jgi:squalene synthase HpnC
LKTMNFGDRSPVSAATQVETPSGKTASTENFPVGSRLLPARLRPHVTTYYAFARAIDDIADNPTLSATEKLARLDGFVQALAGAELGPGFEKAYRLRDSLAATGVPICHGLDLIAAFKQDATKLRYDDWNELMGYCMLSAAPVGRYLLDLHGESPEGYAASDALCSALQVLNQLQDCQDDYRQLDRVYLPQDWLAAAGARVEALDAPSASPALRNVLDRCLDGCADLLNLARPLPAQLQSRRLAMESSVIISIAWKLAALLRRQDPLAGRVELSHLSFIGCGVGGVSRVLLGLGRAQLSLSDRPPAKPS